MKLNDDLPSPKPLHWVGASRRDLRRFPRGVRRVFGQALFDAQRGSKHPAAKPLKGFGGSGVVEVVEEEAGSAYRAVYTVNFVGAVYVLHAFQKKSNRGAKTPPHEIEKVRNRLKEAERDYVAWRERQPGQERQARR
jgi:phage-related protein